MAWRVGDIDYEWTESDTSFDGLRGWAHHGVVALPSGQIVTATASGQRLAIIDGRNVRLTPPLGVTECHAIALDMDADPSPTLWIADNGYKPHPTGRDDEPTLVHPGRVVRVDLDGGLRQELFAAALPTQYRTWRPTGIASSNELIWVADGYGHGVVHCFTRSGDHLWTRDRTDDGTLFVQPHAVALDPRTEEPRILVADRGNHRIVALSMEGEERGSFGTESLTSPSGFALRDSTLWVTELFGGLVVFDVDDRSVIEYGDRRRERGEDWPNQMIDRHLRRPDISDGRFVSPHGIAISSEGVVHITEWIIGGRLIALTPVRQGAQR